MKQSSAGEARTAGDGLFCEDTENANNIVKEGVDVFGRWIGFGGAPGGAGGREVAMADEVGDML